MLRVVLLMSVLIMLNRAKIVESVVDSGMCVMEFDTAEVRKNIIIDKNLYESEKRFRIRIKSLNETPIVIEDMDLNRRLFELTVGIIQEICKINNDLNFDIPAFLEQRDYYSCVYGRKPEKTKRRGIVLYSEGIIIYVDKKTFKIIDVCWRNCK